MKFVNEDEDVSEEEVSDEEFEGEENDNLNELYDEECIFVYVIIFSLYFIFHTSIQQIYCFSRF